MKIAENMYDKLERLWEYIEDQEIEQSVKNHICDMIDDMKRDLEIEENTIEYLNQNSDEYDD